MCGIAGYFGPNPASATALKQTLNTMVHRGPDGAGQIEKACGSNKLQLLHTRLAILDPESRSDQPFCADNCTLIFNGEIYNFLELREELKSLGYNFQTRGDTEVIIKAYKAWGTKCFGRFEGMFAIVLFDEGSGELHLARDSFGEKPLFIQHHNGGVFFASEVKFLKNLGAPKTEINHDRIRNYLLYGYRTLHTGNETYFKDVTFFPKGHFVSLQTPDEFHSKPFWTLSFNPQQMTWDEALEGVKHHLRNAIKLRLRADTRVALTLSGGIDSNVLAGIAAHDFNQTIHSFSMLEAEIGYNEEPLINKAVEALNCDHHILRVHGHDFMDRLPRLVRQHDGPVPTIAMYLDAWLAESVAEAGYKVALNGMGSDEIFSGYYDHYLYYLAGFQGDTSYDSRVQEWYESMGKWIRNPLLKDPHRFSKTPDFRDHLFRHIPDIDQFSVTDFHPFLAEEHYCEDLLRNRMLNELNHEAVPVYLLAGDHNWMEQSVEARSAYLDRDLAEFLYTVPSELLIQKGRAKALLREAGRGLVPNEILDLSRKVGFNARITSLLYRDNKEFVDWLLTDTPIFEIVDKKRIRNLLDPDTNLEGYDNFLFSFTSAQIFYLEQGYH